MKSKEYFLGLDLGTNSVGWAVTDERYKLQRFNKKDMWGSRLFEEAKTANDRRVHRSNRRRLDRHKKRIGLLQELFAEEIFKVDPTFFMRLKESKFHLEDKDGINSKFTLFDDENFTDKEYYEKYPTIYHLRKDLMESEEKKDIRLIYLAIHHIIKNRGHFLFEGRKFDIKGVFDKVFLNLSDYLYDNFNFELPYEKKEEIKNIISDKKLKLKDKSDSLINICNAEEEQFKAILSVMIGGSRKLSKIYNNDELNEAEKNDVDFKKSTFTDEYEIYKQVLKEDILLLDKLKEIYDWVVLSNILGSHKYISHSKVFDYERHKEDLKDLKYIIKKYGKEEDMNNCFNNPKIENNYPSYVKSTLYFGRQNHEKYCSQKDVNNFFKTKIEKLIPDNEDKEIFKRIKSRLEENIALPKLRNTDNGVIPYQFHMIELDEILKNAEKHYDFLKEKKSGEEFTTEEKINKIMTFRIPYYVGPLNTFHSEKNGGNGNSWLVKKEDKAIKDKSILPWNFEEIVDREKSAEEFITRMTNKCTYVLGENVIPKQSLLYEKFMVLNEINNLKIDGKSITIEFKNKIYEELFKQKSKISKNDFKLFLKKNGWDIENVSISGIDKEFKNFLGSYNFFKDIIGGKIEKEPYNSTIEDIIFRKTIFSAKDKFITEKIESEYLKSFTKEQLKKINSKNFSAWGRLSRKFLFEISFEDKETGEIFENIIEALEKTNNNLMELLSSKYTLKEKLEEENRTDEDFKNKINYEKIMKETYLSAPVKRTVWQAVTICEEIRKIRKQPPKRIFLEMTRNPEIKKERKDSRRDDLIKLYEKCKEDVNFIEELKGYDDKKLRTKRLYLYYTQKGRCMYSGEKIDLHDILVKKEAESFYEMDHIYPRSLTKDDSLDNLVLVKKEINGHKEDDLLGNSIRKEMFIFWKQLKDQGFISDKKFFRLIRTEEFSVGELAGFINRQLVETGQAAKAVADILKRIYPETEIVYVKAKTVSDFRNRFKLYKCRELNNFHHSHDAFLNIVVGNSYHTKFTANPYNYIKDKRDSGEDRPYDLDNFFNLKIKRADYVAWDKEYHLPFVSKTLERQTVNVVRKPLEQKGEFFDATIQRKTENKKDTLIMPLKGKDKRFFDIGKYGGYKSVKGAYFFVVEHKEKGKKVITFEQVFLMYADKIKTEKDLIEYCKNILNLEEPKIIEKKVKMGSKLIYENFPLYIQSRTGDRIVMSVAKEILLSKKSTEIFRKISKEYSLLKNKKADISTSITEKEYLDIYDEYIKLLKEGEYKNRSNSPINILINGRDVFKELEEKEKALTILSIHKSFGREGLSGVDLTFIKGKKGSSKIIFNKKITDKEVILINQSPTGLYESRKVLNKK